MKWAFASWSDFWMMGHYALYVWSAVGFTVLMLGGLLVWSIKQHRDGVQQVLEAIIIKRQGEQQ